MKNIKYKFINIAVFLLGAAVLSSSANVYAKEDEKGCKGVECSKINKHQKLQVEGKKNSIIEKNNSVGSESILKSEKAKKIQQRKALGRQQRKALGRQRNVIETNC